MARKPQAPPSETRSADAHAGGVLEALLARRARATSKRLKRIEELEAAAAAGKEMNADQVRLFGGWAGREAPEEAGGGLFFFFGLRMVGATLPTHAPLPIHQLETIASKPSVLALASELTKMTPTILAAAAEDVAAVTAAVSAAAAAAARARARRPPRRPPPRGPPPPLDPRPLVDAAVDRLITLLYYARVLSDVSNPHGAAVAALEREAAASYAATDGGPPLPDAALAAIADAGDALVARPPGLLVSHADALAACAAAARAWASGEGDAATVAALTRLTQLEYVAIVPQLLDQQGGEEGQGGGDVAQARDTVFSAPPPCSGGAEPFYAPPPPPPPRRPCPWTTPLWTPWRRPTPPTKPWTRGRTRTGMEGRCLVWRPQLLRSRRSRSTPRRRHPRSGLGPPLLRPSRRRRPSAPRAATRGRRGRPLRWLARRRPPRPRRHNKPKPTFARAALCRAARAVGVVSADAGAAPTASPRRRVRAGRPRRVGARCRAAAVVAVPANENERMKKI